MTRLDEACATIMRDDNDHAARLSFYSLLADTLLFVMLEEDAATADQVRPRLFELEDGPVVLVFDLEERLTEFVGGPAPYAALPGRVIAAQLAGQGIGLGLNVGVTSSSIMLPAEAMEWLTRTLDTRPKQVAAIVLGFSPPWGIPASVTDRLLEKLSVNAGLADAVLLAEVVYQGGRKGHILAVLGTVEGAEAALSGAVSEALIFSGLDMAEMDVVFLAPDDPRAKIIEDVALRLDLPRAMIAPKTATLGPGVNRQKPPNLR